MDPIRLTLKNSGDQFYNDTYYSGPAFNLTDQSYIIRVSPKTPVWRFGIQFSRTADPSPLVMQRYSNEYKYLQISRGTKDQHGKWDTRGRLKIESVYFDIRIDAEDADPEFLQSGFAELALRHNPADGILTVIYKTKKDPHEMNLVLPRDFHYFQVFAWAEFMSYELDCTIEVDTDISDALIRKNKKINSKTLDLTHCGIKEFPKEVTKMGWLEELIVGSGSYYDYYKKKRVSTQNIGPVNTFSQLPKGIGKLKNLKTLVICGSKTNPLVPIDLSEIAGLTQLEFLCIAFSPLTDLSPLAKLTGLRQLYLYDDELTDISPLSALTELRAFRFRGNNIQDISCAAKMTNLEVLRFGKNQVADLSPLSGLTKLENLSFYSNRVADITALRDLRSMKKLSFRGNQVASIIALEKMHRLEELDFRTNQVTEITALPKAAPLKKLYFRKNGVSAIFPLIIFLELEELDFGSNPVEDITPLSDLKSLQKVSFSDCPVKKISPLTDIPSLKNFSCEDCPIEDFPADVYETGDPQLLKDYYIGQIVSRGLEKDLIVSKPLRLKGAHNPKAKTKTKEAPADLKRDVKLIILGNSNTGKTNLANYLEKAQFSGGRQTTHGLEVHRWLPDEKTFPCLKDIAVSIWDFGGQEYYHGSYRLFLSANTVYLLVWSQESDINGRRKTLLRDGEAEVDLEHFELRYWLDTIRHYSGGRTNAPLLTVQNKTDDPAQKKRIAQELHNRYGIRDSFHISLKDGADKKNSRQYDNLHYFLAELGYVIESGADKASIPIHWQQIRNKVLSLRDSVKKNEFSPYIKHDLWISLPDFKTACNAIIKGIVTNISPGSDPYLKDEQSMPLWLNRGGVAVFFPGIDSLKDKLFLRPDELARQIYEVLNQEVLRRGGEFSLGDILTKKDPVFRNVFLEIAQNLELIFPHPLKGKDHYIAPQYLPDSHPIEDLFKIASKDAWLSAFWVRTPLFYYKMLLHGLLIHYASEKNTSCPYFWKHGILFIRNGLRILIKGLYPAEDEQEGTILISVEKDAQTQPALQKEIFSKFFDIIKKKEALASGNKVEFSVTESVPQGHEAEDRAKLVKDVPIQVSYNGKDYVGYDQLLQNEKEPRIKASNSNTWLVMKNFAPILPFTPTVAKKVFLSYSHQDIAWFNRLRTHLAGLRRAKEIETWHDKELLPGDLWDTVIKKSLEEADVFILLLSADFIASDYIWNEELGTILRSFRERGALVIPILFEPLDLGGIPGISVSGDGQLTRINDFEIIPKNVKEQLQAVSLWNNQEEALAKIAASIRQAVQK